MINDGCVKGKDSFDANTKTGLANGYCLARSTMFAGNHHALKSLESLFGFGFLDPYMYANCIARLKPRNVLTQLRFFNSI